MPCVVSEGALSAACIGHCLRQIIVAISIRSCALFRCCLQLQATVAIISKASHAITLLRDAGYLIARVVGVVSRCVDALIPVQLLHFRKSCERIHRGAAPPARLVYTGHDFTTSAAAAAVDILARPAIRV